MKHEALFEGEDYLTICLSGDVDINVLAAAMHKSERWEEVVRGMTDLTVKYDPLKLSSAEAKAHFLSLLGSAESTEVDCGGPMTLAASFGAECAPDADEIALSLEISAKDWPQWLCSRTYRVTMMGFQPGFAYLEDIEADALPSLPRLNTPRQKVAAGSIGFLGKRACLYAWDGPGGWPIGGRIAESLFRGDQEQPFLLRPGQLIRLAAS